MAKALKFLAILVLVESLIPFSRVMAQELLSSKGSTNGLNNSKIQKNGLNITESFQEDENVAGSMTYTSAFKMRENLRMGAGLSIGGQLGALGINSDLNFEDENSAVAGFGRGPGYNSVQLAWKHTLDGDYLSPYFTAGYSRWFNSYGKGDSWKDSSILSRVLTSDEKKSGRFGTDFMNLSFGIQYNQLSGPFYGFSCYAEFMAMYEIKRSQIIPTGAVGSIYYF